MVWSDKSNYAGLSAGIGVGLIVVVARLVVTRLVAGIGRRAVLHLVHSLELLIRNGIRGQVAGADLPGFLVVVVLGTVCLLYTS